MKNIERLTLDDLNFLVTHIMRNGCGDYPVNITLAQPSVGVRAHVGIRNLYRGIDWESNQIRVETTEKITAYKKDRDEIMQPWVKTYELNGRKRKIILCPKCENHLRKDDKYCSNCGQRVG